MQARPTECCSFTPAVPLYKLAGESDCRVIPKVFQVYCVHAGRHECGVCDAADPHKSHPIGSAIDGEETWWQSPSLQNGPEFHYVTITVDLKEVRQ